MISLPYLSLPYGSIWAIGSSLFVPPLAFKGSPPPASGPCLLSPGMRGSTAAFWTIGILRKSQYPPSTHGCPYLRLLWAASSMFCGFGPISIGFRARNLLRPWQDGKRKSFGVAATLWQFVHIATDNNSSIVTTFAYFIYIYICIHLFIYIYIHISLFNMAIFHGPSCPIAGRPCNHSTNEASMEINCLMNLSG